MEHKVHLPAEIGPAVCRSTTTPLRIPAPPRTLLASAELRVEYPTFTYQPNLQIMPLTPGPW